MKTLFTLLALITALTIATPVHASIPVSDVTDEHTSIRTVKEVEKHVTNDSSITYVEITTRYIGDDTYTNKKFKVLTGADMDACKTACGYDVDKESAYALSIDFDAQSKHLVK